MNRVLSAGAWRCPLPSPRLRFCRWSPRFIPAIQALYGDPRVMMHAPATLSEDEVLLMAEHNRAHFEQHGYGLWVVTLPDSCNLMGVAGLTHSERSGSATPSVELSWHLACEFWGSGYATEIAHAVCAWGFQALQVDEIVAVTAHSNLRSQGVLQRLGMRTRVADQFIDTSLAAGHRLSQQLLYRLSRKTWQHGGAVMHSCVRGSK